VKRYRSNRYVERFGCDRSKNRGKGYLAQLAGSRRPDGQGNDSGYGSTDNPATRIDREPQMRMIEPPRFAPCELSEHGADRNDYGR
jgi:hypothetical protein